MGQFILNVLTSYLPFLILATMGIVLIFKTSSTTNFAQGMIGVFGAFLTSYLIDRVGVSDYTSSPSAVPNSFLHLVLCILGGMLLSFLIGLFIDGVIFRFSKYTNAATKQIITMGIVILFSGLIPIVFGEAITRRSFPFFGDSRMELFGIQYTSHRLFTMILAISIISVIFILLKYTKWGLGVRSVASNEKVATGRMIYIPFSATTADAAVTTALTHNPGAIIMAANQAPATAAATALAQKGSQVPVFSSYVNSQAVFIAAQQTNENEELLPLPYDVYANAWVDIVDPTQEAPTAEMVGREGILVGFNDAGSALETMGAGALAFLPGFTEEYWDFVKLLNESDRVSGDTSARMLWANSYAMAGYVAAKTFVALLDRVEDFHELTWESFVELAEEAPIKLPLAGTVDWKDGYRQGLIALALNKLTYPAGKPAEFAKVREIELLEDIIKK